MAEQEKTPNAQPNLQVQKITPGEDFSEDYANTFSFEHSAWDFKIVFGQMDQMAGRSDDNVNWHTAITMPWGVMKVLSHMLILNVAAYELQFGHIQIPPSVMPPEPMEPTGELDTLATRTLYKMQLEWRRALIGTGDPKVPLIPVPESKD